MMIRFAIHETPLTVIASYTFFLAIARFGQSAKMPEMAEYIRPC
jgi:hypothetical protein